MSMNNDWIKISDGDKLILIMLCSLFKKLGIDDSVDPSFVEGAIYGGHSWALEYEYPGIFEKEDEHSAVNEVFDILGIWWVIESSRHKFSEEENNRIDEEIYPRSAVFEGFDGNNETEYYAISKFIIDKTDKFEGFKGRDLNSHMEMLHAYRWMLSEIEKVENKYDLNPDDIIKLCKRR